MASDDASIPDAMCGDERRFGTLTERMSALGQKRTSRAIAIYVRYWGLSGHNQFESGHCASAPSMVDDLAVDDLAVMDDHRI